MSHRFGLFASHLVSLKVSVSLTPCPSCCPCFLRRLYACSVCAFPFFSTLMAALDSRGLLHNEQFYHLIGYFFPRCVHALIICCHTNRYVCFYTSNLMSGFIALANWRFDILTRLCSPIGQPADWTIGVCAADKKMFNILHVLLSIPPNLNIVIAISLRPSSWW